MRYMEPYVYSDKGEEDVYKIHGNTFPIKDQIKAIGGIWDGSVWTVYINDLNVLRNIGVLIRVPAIREKFCHTPEQKIYIPEYQLKQGFVPREFCSYCDSQHGQVKVRPVE